MGSVGAGERHRLTFRTATCEDAGHITLLINTAFRSERTGDTWLYDEQDKRIDILPITATLAMIAGSDTVMLIGELSNPPPSLQDPRIAACYLRRPSVTPQEVQRHPHVSPTAAWMGLLAVSPDAQGRGLGREMLAGAERFVREQWEAKRLEFDFVHTRRELKAWYERLGYRETGKWREFLYPEGGREILRGGLRQIVLGRDL